MTNIPSRKSNISFAWKYLKTEKCSFIIAVIFVIINALLQTLTPVSIEFLINNAIKDVNYTQLWQVTIIMCGLFLVESVFFRYQVITVGYAAQRIMYKIRTNIFSHIQKLSSEFFNKNKSGDLISRINGDTALLDNFLGEYIFSFTSSFFVFIAFGFYLFLLEPKLALVAYFCIFITIIISYILKPFVEKFNKQSLESNGSLKAFLADNLNNYQVIQSYNMGNKLEQNFKSFNVNNQLTNRSARSLTNLFNPIYNLTGNIALVLILFVILYFNFATNYGITIGALVAFIYATVKFFIPLRELGSVFSALTEAISALNRIREILEETTNKTFSISNSNDIIETENSIVFKNVDFSYSQESENVLNKISFTVPRNSKFAIIGPTGEGKSTIAKLISGLLIPKSGSVKIFDRPLKDWSEENFYNTIGFILQDPFMFSGTVASNIIYGNKNYKDYTNSYVIATEKEEIEANMIKKLIKDITNHNLDLIIPDLDSFLRTEINNNSQNISQGQKQIINFIRVLLRDPKIIILDEATANLDTITEKNLQQTLDSLTSKVTQIIIAHRLNTIKNADYIMLVGGGNVEVSENKTK
jgi:ATP-binding cassette, subfamily B, bacterial